MTITRAVVRRWLPRRRPATHKGDYGRVLIVAGSRGMSGAAVLAAQAALRTGSGLVYLAIPKSVQPLVVRKLTEVITIPVAETRDRTFASSAVRELASWLARVDAIAIGPGLTTQPQTIAFVRRLLQAVRVPVVVDADALNACIGKTLSFKRCRAPLVLTPHPGEMSRLTGVSTAAIQRDRAGVARRFAKTWRAVVVLKGHRTVIAVPRGRVYVNTTGNPGMATAGTGDVLTGMIVSLLGQGVSSERAAVAAVYLHGLAGDLVARRLGTAGLIASDLLATIPQAIQRCQHLPA